MKNLLLCILMMAGSSSILWADPITFEATVNTPRISMDEALQLTLTITGVNQDLDPINLPVLNGFSARYLGPSTSVSIVNGDYHSERSFIYNLFPNKTGHFQIPPISATLSGQTYTTKPIDVEVFESSAQAQASGGGADQNQVPSPGGLKLIVSVDKTDVYLNQRIPVTFKLLINGVPMRDIQYPQFDRTGFAVDEWEKPVQGSQVDNGVRYDTVEFKTNVYPNRLGDLAIGPVQVQGNVLYKSAPNNPFNQNNDFFGTNVFNNLFDTYTSRPMSVTATPIQLHVSTLPDDNRPQDFSGAIGQFDFVANVAPLQVKAGDPLTLKMSVKGSGNFKSFKMPDFKAPNFKSYDPQIKDLGGEKTSEEVIIPTSTGVKEVPALQFSFFDPSTKDYKTITQGPFAIQVSAPSPDQDFKAVGFSNMAAEPTALAVNQFSFGKMFNDFCKIMKKLGKSIWFWALLGVVFVAGASYFLWQRFQDRLENDPAFARRLKAVKEARQALAPAGEIISAGRSKDFYALLSKVLRDYLANKWHQSSAALSVHEILSQLKEAKLDEAYIARIRSLLENADLVCFAGAQRSPADMRSDLSATQELIASLEKILK